MPKFIRKNLQGIEFVHVTTHGIDDKYIYESTREKKEIRKLILQNQEEFNITIMSYCIMNNHLHLLIKFKNPEDLSEYMHKVNTSYAIYYNKQHERSGYVYKDRFYSQIIKDRMHLINAIVYIHNNPVKARICDTAQKYEFSSYQDILNGKSKETMSLFRSKNQYIEAHMKKDNTILCLVDFEKVSLEEAKEIFDKYLKNNRLDEELIKEKKEKLYEICKELKEIYKITYRDLEKITGVGRETIRRLLIKKNNNRTYL